jgi:Mlc titration factor MtfA (ptsG expression regulator)
MYNDAMTALTKTETAFVKDIQPGALSKNFLANHEMGHLLAVAHGELPENLSVLKSASEGDWKASFRWAKAKHTYHIDLMKKHGLKYKDLRKLSKYAATEPAEALAELAGHYFTPEFRANMAPEMVAKAEAMFNDMGGVAA